MRYSILSVFMLFLLNAFAQEKANYIIQGEFLGEVPSIAQRIEDGTFIKAEEKRGEVNPKRMDANLVVPGKGLPTGGDPLRSRTDGPQLKSVNAGPIMNFAVAASNATPTDPSGAVGPNHFINAYNSAFRIWDKEGGSLTVPASLANIWPGEDLGDPIVFFDQLANRFVITQFSNSPNGFLVAVCVGEDPVNDGWYTYRFNTNSFPDYPKYSVWSDGYYVTANKNSFNAGSTQVVYAMEREKMLVGDDDALMLGFPLPGITTFGFYSPLGFNVLGEEAPPTGSAPIVYLQDDNWFGVNDDHLKIWNIDADWENPSASEISSPQILETSAFDNVFDGGSFQNLPQPSGPDIDALQATVMYQTHYRRFEDYNSVVLNFVVDSDGSGDLAGIRWYELRQENDGDEWTIYQEGTYEQPSGHSAFCGAIGMDRDGNIGLAYTVVGPNQVPSLRYTGRFANDPLGTMTLDEAVIFNGSQSSGAFRYGDYAQVTIDPVDDKTFWYIGEYFALNTRRNGVGVFRISADIGVTMLNEPVSAPGLTDTEPVTISIENFSGESVSNFEVSYALDGGTVITETIEGPIAVGETIVHTFSTPADLSVIGEYDFEAKTEFPLDAQPDNDALEESVSHLICQPGGDCSQGDGILVFELIDLNNDTGCSGSGYSDFTNEEVGLGQGGDYEMTITTGFGNQFVKAWIDFNDNFLFEEDEVIIDNVILAEGQGAGSFTESIPFSIPADAPFGEHILRVRTNRDVVVPDDACASGVFGETEDYTVDIGVVGIEEQILGDQPLLVIPNGTGRYRLSFDSETVNRPLIMTIHNTVGQVVIQHWVRPSEGQYRFEFDMSYAAKGAYLLRLGDFEVGKVSRFIVD